MDGRVSDAMRLDRFLWFARIAKTREVAQAMACDGHLRLDGRAIAKAAALVRIGSVLTFAKAGHVRVLRVEALPLRRGPATEARLCYQELTAGTPANDSQEGAHD